MYVGMYVFEKAHGTLNHTPDTPKLHELTAQEQQEKAVIEAHEHQGFEPPAKFK